MNTRTIVLGIDSTICDRTQTKRQKVQRLQELAQTYWKAVFPELESGTFSELTPEEVERRWAIVRRKNEIQGTRYPHIVECILDWPGTGMSFGSMLPAE